MGKAARNAQRLARRADVEATRAREAAERADADHPLTRLVNAPTPLARLHSVRDVREWLDELEHETVRELRQVAVPWVAIGKALGITGQAVAKRYGAGRPPSP